MSTNISNLAWDTRVTRENFDLDHEHQLVKIFYKTGTLTSPGGPDSGGKKLKTESEVVKLADLGPVVCQPIMALINLLDMTNAHRTCLPSPIERQLASPGKGDHPTHPGLHSWPTFHCRL